MVILPVPRFTYSPDRFQRNPGWKGQKSRKAVALERISLLRELCDGPSTHFARTHFRGELHALSRLAANGLAALGADLLHHLRSCGRGMLGADRLNDDPGLYGGRVGSDLNRNAPVFEAAQPLARSPVPFQARAT